MRDHLETPRGSCFVEVPGLRYPRGAKIMGSLALRLDRGGKASCRHTLVDSVKCPMRDYPSLQPERLRHRALHGLRM